MNYNRVCKIMDEFPLSAVKFVFKDKAAFSVVNYFPHAHTLVQLIIINIYVDIYTLYD